MEYLIEGIKGAAWDVFSSFLVFLVIIAIIVFGMLIGGMGNNNGKPPMYGS